MASLSDRIKSLREDLKNRLGDFDNQVKEVNASKQGRAKELNSWVADRNKEIQEINKDYQNRLNDLNKEFNQRVNDFNKDTNNERNARQRDINNEKDKESKKRMQAELAEWNKQRERELSNLQKEKTNAINDTNKNKTNDIEGKNNEIKQYKADYANWIKEQDTRIQDIGKEKAAFNKEQNAAITRRTTAEAQSKKLGIDADELEQILANQQEYKELKKEYRPYAKQLPKDAERDANIKATAAALKVDPSVLQNYFQQKEIAPIYEQEQAAFEEYRRQQGDAAAAQAKRQAEYQAAVDKLTKENEAEAAKNYTAMYDMLTQNMPAPVGLTPAQAFSANAPLAQSPAEQARLQGMMQGLYGQMPQGIQQGMPQDMYGPPQGMPPDMYGIQQGMPQQISPLGYGMPQGMPQGMPPGMYNMPPQGLAQAQQPVPVPMQQEDLVPTSQQPVSMRVGGIVRGY